MICVKQIQEQGINKKRDKVLYFLFPLPHQQHHQQCISNCRKKKLVCDIRPPTNHSRTKACINILRGARLRLTGQQTIESGSCYVMFATFILRKTSQQTISNPGTMEIKTFTSFLLFEKPGIIEFQDTSVSINHFIKHRS